jgi:hypothetical protein
MRYGSAHPVEKTPADTSRFTQIKVIIRKSREPISADIDPGIQPLIVTIQVFRA